MKSNLLKAVAKAGQTTAKKGNGWASLYLLYQKQNA